jgi:ankyrin repeat protein
MAPLNLKSQTTDAQQVQSVRDGNRSAFDVLMQQYKNRVYAVALGMISDFDDAETVAQAQLLVDHGAHINPKDHEGNTPLDLAIDRKRKNLIIFLCKNGGE